MRGKYTTSVTVLFSIGMLLICSTYLMAYERTRCRRVCCVEVVQPVNEHELDVAVSKCEGHEVNLPIAQISECRKCVLEEVAKYDDARVLQLVHRHRKPVSKEAVRHDHDDSQETEE